jgi:hypothetical protein
MDSLVVQTAIGLVFVFASFAALVSVLTEAIARFIGLRGEYLLRGIRTLVESQSQFKLSFGDLFGRKPKDPAPPEVGPNPPVVTKLVNHPLVAVSADKGRMPPHAGNAKLTNPQRRNLPAYLSGRSFARALIDIAIPDATGTTTIDQIRTSLAGEDVPEHLRKPLMALAIDAGDDIAAFRSNVEQWYDDHMARVSGWYKRHVRWISLALGALLVLAFNLNVLSIGRALYTDQALRGSVVTQATQASQCGTKDPATCLRELRTELDRARGAGLPVGWATVPSCASSKCNWLEQRGLIEQHNTAGHNLMAFLLVLVGWALMVIALLPGARFWFDLLSRLGSLRSTGPKPVTP